MKLLKSFLLASSALAITSAVVGCSESGVEPIQKPSGDNTQIEYSSSSNYLPSIYDQELEFNYDILDFFYLYAHTKSELDSYDYYYYVTDPISIDHKSYCSDKYGRICNMYSDMSDDFTRYFDPMIAETIMKNLTESEELVGIGATVKEAVGEDSTKSIVVDQVFENGPSYMAGLTVGDTILLVNGTEPKDYGAFMKLIQGDIMDKLSIKVRRGTADIDLVIVINTFSTPTVYLSYEDSVPVIRISEFVSSSTNKDGTKGEFYKILENIVKDNKSAIIDLRGNPGGDVDQCNGIAEYMLSKGDTIIIDIETDVDSSGYGNNIYYYFNHFISLLIFNYIIKQRKNKVLLFFVN